jgi:putative ABC transport system permease protein
MARAALALYRLAARVLLPGDFHAEFGLEMEAAVSARLRVARGALGPPIALLAELADLTRTALREWSSATADAADLRASRPTRGETRMSGGWRDLETSARNLARRPALAIGVTLTIGLGIGATTTIYSVVDGVILRPLPFQDPSRLVAIGGVASGNGSFDPETGLQELVPMSSSVYAGYRERARSMDEVAAITPSRIVLSDADGLQEQVGAARVSPEFLQMLGASPVLGRAFLPEEHSIPAAPVAMITYEYWQRRYGGDPDVLGRPLETTVSAEAPRSTIVGILPRGFLPPDPFFDANEPPQVYQPMPLTEAGSHVRMLFTVYAMGRLTPSSTLEQARAEAVEIATELEPELDNALMRPGATRIGIGLNDLHAQTVGSTARTLWVFLGAAGLLLLLTAMNAATLFLARALDRRQELSVRLALGAGRTRVMRLLVGEAGILSAAGGALGVALAYGGVGIFLRFAPRSIPRLDTIAVDGRVLLAAALATLATAFTAGLLPALRLTDRGSWEHIQSGGRTVSEPGSRLRTALVGGQLALAVVLLCGAGLLFSSFMRIRAADPGFEAEGLVAVMPAATGPLRFDQAQVRAAWRRWDPILEGLAAVPGVEAVAGASLLPFQAPTWAPRVLLPEDEPAVVREGIAGYVISPGYLETMGTQVLRGRALQARDGPDAEPVVLVNEAFVRTQLGGRDALGVSLRRRVVSPFADSDMVSMRIVGIVEDVVQTRAEDGPRPAIYVPYGQADLQQVASFWSVVRTDLPIETVIPELRRTLAEHERVPQSVATMYDRVATSQATPRFHAMLIGTFALVAMLLAAVGLHGSLAHAVRRRQRELGVRMALGADASSVLGMVLAQGMRVAAAGLVVGMLATLALSRVLGAFLYDMEPYDPLTLLGVAATLMLVSAVACLAPARRATSIDPVKVLSAE